MVKTRTKPTTMAVMVRRVPRGLWQKLKIRAAQEDISIQTLVLSWIQQYANGRAVYADSGEGELIDAAQGGMVRNRR